MSAPRRPILVINPTPHEYGATLRHLKGKEFKRIRPVIHECGPGKINAAFALTAAWQELKRQGETPLLVIGAGTAGALAYGVKTGDVIFSATSIFSDYRMLTERGSHNSPYGELNFIEPDDFRPEDIAIVCRDPLISELGAMMEKNHCQSGAMLTSDTFITGKGNRLDSGEYFGCLACDMESGAFAYVADSKFNMPWFNLRIVADSLDEDFECYVLMEEEMTELLAGRLMLALKVLDEML